MAERPKRACGMGLLALWLSAWCATSARAEPFAYSTRVDLGQPPRTTPIAVNQTADGAAELILEGARSALPIRSPQRADVQSIRLQNGSAVVLLRVTAAEGREAAALLGRRRTGRAEVLWSGALDPRGDPGERRAHAIDVQDHNGDGSPDVVVGQLDERARICGQTRTVLRPQLLDPDTLRLRPTVLARLPEARPAVAEIAMTEESPGPTHRPLLRSLRLVGVSSQPGNESEPWLATLPSALTDGDPSTFWTEGHAAGGRGEFASFQWDAGGYEIRALAVVPLPAGLPADRPVAVARVLWLVGEQGARVRLKLPDRVQPGQRYWAALATPLAGRCVSLVFDQASPAQASKAGPAVLAEVEAYTELDFNGGVDRLVQQLAVGGARAADAVHLLSTLGPDVVGKLQKVWPTLPDSGRRRAVRVLATHAGTEPAARDVLASALDDADPDVRRLAFEALVAAGPAARALLVPQVAQPGKAGDAAALALARNAPGEAITTLLAALEREGGSGRAALREAIALASRMGGGSVLDAVRAWTVSGAASVGSRAAVALALSTAQDAGARSLATELIAGASTQAKEFEDLWRLVRASRALESAAPLDSWLAAIAKSDEHWMLRAAAVEALADRKSAAAPQVAATALGDVYPRVRASAAGALASHVEAQRLLTEHALRDRWPMVRAAALDAVSGQPGAEPVLRKGVEDASRFGRAAAIRGLTKAKVRGAWPLVKARLEDKKEWPEVLTEGVRFAGELCVHEATPVLLELLERGVKPDAWAPDAELAVQALEALLKLGGSASKAAARLANSEAAPPSFRALIESAPAGRSVCAAAP